jgi:hypothetical protein
LEWVDITTYRALFFCDYVKKQRKNTVKTGGVFHISKGYFGDNFPLQTAKNPPENSVILSPKKRYF